LYVIINVAKYVINTGTCLMYVFPALHTLHHRSSYYWAEAGWGSLSRYQPWGWSGCYCIGSTLCQLNRCWREVGQYECVLLCVAQMEANASFLRAARAGALDKVLECLDEHGADINACNPVRFISVYVCVWNTRSQWHLLQLQGRARPPGEACADWNILVLVVWSLYRATVLSALCSCGTLDYLSWVLSYIFLAPLHDVYCIG